MRFLLAAAAAVAMALGTAIPAHADGVTVVPGFPGRVQLGKTFEATVTIANPGPDRVQVGNVDAVGIDMFAQRHPADANPARRGVQTVPTVRATADGLPVGGADEVSVFPR